MSSDLSDSEDEWGIAAISVLKKGRKTPPSKPLANQPVVSPGMVITTASNPAVSNAGLKNPPNSTITTAIGTILKPAKKNPLSYDDFSDGSDISDTVPIAKNKPEVPITATHPTVLQSGVTPNPTLQPTLLESQSVASADAVRKDVAPQKELVDSQKDLEVARRHAEIGALQKKLEEMKRLAGGINSTVLNTTTVLDATSSVSTTGIELSTEIKGAASGAATGMISAALNSPTVLDPPTGMNAGMNGVSNAEMIGASGTKGLLSTGSSNPDILAPTNSMKEKIDGGVKELDKETSQEYTEIWNTVFEEDISKKRTSSGNWNNGKSSSSSRGGWKKKKSTAGNWDASAWGGNGEGAEHQADYQEPIEINLSATKSMSLHSTTSAASGPTTSAASGIHPITSAASGIHPATSYGSAVSYASTENVAVPPPGLEAYAVGAACDAGATYHPIASAPAAYDAAFVTAPTGGCEAAAVTATYPPASVYPPAPVSLPTSYTPPPPMQYGTPTVASSYSPALPTSYDVMMAMKGMKGKPVVQ